MIWPEGFVYVRNHTFEVIRTILAIKIDIYI